MFNQFRIIKQSIETVDEILKDMEQNKELFKDNELKLLSLQEKLMADRERWQFLYKRHVVTVAGISAFVLSLILFLSNIVLWDDNPWVSIIASSTGLIAAATVRRYYKEDSNQAGVVYALMIFAYAALIFSNIMLLIMN